MYWKETGGVEKLFSLPSRIIPAKALFLNYQRHIVSHFTALEDFLSLAPSDILALDQITNEDSTSVLNNRRGGRKRKIDQIAVNNATQLNADAVSSLSNNLSGLEEMREQQCLDQPSELMDNGGIDVDHNAVEGISHTQSYDFNDVGVSDNLGSIADIAYTPLNINGMEISGECNNGNLTPSQMHAEHSSPQHHDIECIQSIPNLPADQVSSILNEAENMPHCSQDSALLNNLDKTLVADWSDMNFPASMELEVFIISFLRFVVSFNLSSTFFGVF